MTVLIDARGEPAYSLTIADELCEPLLQLLAVSIDHHETDIFRYPQDSELYRAWLVSAQTVRDALEAGECEVSLPVAGTEYLHGALGDQVIACVTHGEYADAALWIGLLAQFLEVDGLV